MNIIMLEQPPYSPDLTVIPPPLKYQESHAAENHSRGAWSYGRGQGIKIKGGKLVVWT